ncbi:hypothetical protein ACGFYU_11180 [Streptomyces sp. NPDC048337]|uniref:hypothetical protein n=1 Tax=Streptomyces sp. NPDC048337 TaxID=3365535 RepID=UPI00371995A4
MRLLPRAAAALLLGAAAAACTDHPPPPRPDPPARTTTPTPAATTAVPVPPTPAATSAVPVPPAPAVLTQADNGRTVVLPLGAATQLRLSGRWQEATPTVDGTAIVLVPVDFETDPGFRAWDVHAAGPGKAVLHVPGRPGLTPLRITFLVR